jgi:hypothetical protein
VEGGVGAEVGVQEAHKKSFPVLRHMPARPPARQANRRRECRCEGCNTMLNQQPAGSSGGGVPFG